MAVIGDDRILRKSAESRSVLTGRLHDDRPPRHRRRALEGLIVSGKERENRGTSKLSLSRTEPTKKTANRNGPLFTGNYSDLRPDLLPFYNSFRLHNNISTVNLWTR